MKELEKPGRDPRDEMPKPILRTDVLDMKDLKEGMILKGTVRNVIDFGAFVDIGVHQDGLVHISQMTDKKFVKHPLEVVSVGDIVEVKVIGVDLQKKRISLTHADLRKRMSAHFSVFCGSKGILVPTDAYELLRCEAASAILKTFEIR